MDVFGASCRLNLKFCSKNIFHLETSNFRKRIVNIIGDKINEKLVPIKEETKYTLFEDAKEKES